MPDLSPHPADSSPRAGSDSRSSAGFHPTEQPLPLTDMPIPRSKSCWSFEFLSVLSCMNSSAQSVSLRMQTEVRRCSPKNLHIVRGAQEHRKVTNVRSDLGSQPGFTAPRCLLFSTP